MRCERCGAELSEDGRCMACGAEDTAEAHVQVLSRAERNAYTGITIDEGMEEENDRVDIRFERRTGNNWGGFSYMTSGGSWPGKLMLILGAAAILCFVFFIALPVAMVVLLFGVILWILRQFLY